MKEGRIVDIGFRGIVRNSSIGASYDGELEELINLREEDGSLKPTPPYEQVAGFGGVDMSAYSNVFVHAGSSYKNYLGLKEISNGYALYYFASIDKAGKITMLRERKLVTCDMDIEFNQVGNMIVVAGENTFSYLLFDVSKRQYIEVGGDFNGLPTDTLLKPDLDIRFRVTPCVTVNDDLDVLVYCGGSGVRNSMDIPVFENGYPLNTYNAMMLKALRCEKELGRLKGFFKLIYAYELFDGNHILHSQPILMGQANDYYTRLSGTMNAIDPKDNQSIVIDFKDYYLQNEIVYDCGGLNRSIVNMYNGGRLDDMYWSNNDACSEKNFCFRPKRYSKASRVQVFAGDDNGYKHVQNGDCLGNLYVSDYFINLKRSTMNIVSVANKLQYKVDKDIAKDYQGIIKGVSVFISKEVYGYDTDKVVRKERISWNYATHNEPANYYSYQFKNKGNKEIIEELERHDLYYKVCSIEFDKLSKGDWIDIDLKKDGVLANLEANDRLKVDNGSRNSYAGKTTLTYNGKLHVADCKEIPFRGYPLDYFFKRESERGQFPTNAVELWKSNITPATRQLYRGKKAPMISIEVEIDTEYGKSKVVRYEDVPLNYIGSLSSSLADIGLGTNKDMILSEGKVNNHIDINSILYSSKQNSKTIYWLNPMLSYPDSRAKKMTITIQNEFKIPNQHLNIARYGQLSVELKESQYNNIAYYIDPNMKPIQIPLDKILEQPMELPSEIIHEDIQGNKLRVSEVSNPMYFPAKSTYRVGSGRIVKMASNSVSVGSGQTGAAPLMVFCTDGIWALMVDGSGELTYTNSRPIARDVVNNKHNVKSIDGGIVFGTDRGLMVIEGTNVVEVGRKIEGEIQPHFAGNPPFGKLMYARELWDSSKSVELLKESSDLQNFTDYLKQAKIGYNYNKRELVVANSDKPYHYLLSRKGNWYKRIGRIRYFIEDYPNTLINIDNKILRLNSEENIPVATQKGVNTGFVTRAIKIAQQSFKQITRVILRGWYEVLGQPFVNYIDCNDLDTSPKIDRVIELSDPEVRPVVLYIKATTPTEISNTTPQPTVNLIDTDIDIEQAVNYRIDSDSSTLFMSGLIAFSYDKFVRSVATPKPGLLIKASVTAEIDAAVCGGHQKQDIVFDYYINKTTQGLHVCYRTYDGWWLMSSPTNHVRNSRGELMIGWRWSQRRGEFSVVKLPSQAVSMYSNPDKYYGQVVDGSQQDRVLSMGVLIVSKKPTVEPCMITLERGDVYEINICGEGGALQSENSSYRFKHTDNSMSLTWQEFLNRKRLSRFQTTQLYNDHTFTMRSGYPYKLKALDNTEYNFIYEGEGSISYSSLLTNLQNGIYRQYSGVMYSPEYVNVKENESLRIITPGGGFKYLLYDKPTGRIRSSELLDMANDINAKPIPYLNVLTLDIKRGVNLEVKYRDKSYSGVFDHPSYTDEVVRITAQQLLQNFESNLYRPIPDRIWEFTFAMSEGWTYFRDKGVAEGQKFYYRGNNIIRYGDLKNGISGGVYEPYDEGKVKYAGVYVYGSYDGKQWALLGRREATGNFRDIGCLVERTDCKYFKVMFFGNLSSNSTIDHIELQGKETIYNNKIR